MNACVLVPVENFPVVVFFSVFFFLLSFLFFLSQLIEIFSDEYLVCG